MIFGSRILLNQGEQRAPEEGQAVDAALSLALGDLKAEFMDPETGRIHYEAMAGSELFRMYEGLASGLRSFPLEDLREKDQRLAFWINVYNAAVIHGVVRLGIRRSVREVPKFFKRVSYQVGGHLFSLHHMEHGILRGNRRPPYGLLRPFGRGDPRRAFSVRPLDPRIHFALVCGARSCPPVGFYEGDRVEFQLELASLSFINGPGVKFLKESKTILLSRIFKWYKGDFGGMEGVMDLLLRYLDPGEAKEAISQEREQLAIRFEPYDWALNQ